MREQPFKIETLMPRSIAQTAGFSTPEDERTYDGFRLNVYATDMRGRSIKLYDGFWMTGNDSEAAGLGWWLGLTL